jgi:hypothetical protein
MCAVVLSRAAMSLQFTGQELVPHDWLLQWPPDEVIQLVEFLHGCEDHISLAAGFEICARQLARDARFVVLGEHLLDRLFAEPDAMLARCQRFAAAFVLATVRLALHERTQSRPVFWRRCAAAAHAALVARTLGRGQFGGEELLDWAMERHGNCFLCFRSSTFAITSTSTTSFPSRVSRKRSCARRKYRPINSLPYRMSRINCPICNCWMALPTMRSVPAFRMSGCLSLILARTSGCTIA